VNDRVETAFKYLVDRLLVGDVATDEVIAGILRHIRQAFRVSCVGKLVEVEELEIAAGL
jgi:hypothetical protein